MENIANWFVLIWFILGFVGTFMAIKVFRTKGLTLFEKFLCIIGVLLGPITFVIFILDWIKWKINS